MRRLGLYLGRLPGFDKGGLDRRALIECVRAAEACGYDSFWLPEAWGEEAFTLLTELAVHTKRIGLATGIINIFSRSPALIAMSAATLDDISGGRFRLGLGTSGARVIEDFHSLLYHKPLRRMRECVQIIRALLSGDTLEFEGECLQVKHFKLGCQPRRAEIPIYIAALSPKSLRQLGEIADGWLPTHWPRAHLADGIREIHGGAQRVGRDPNHIEIAPFINLVVGNDRARARHAARLPLAYYIGGMGDFYHASLTRLGFAEEADRVKALWQAGKPKSAMSAVTDEMVEAIAICGDVEWCRAQLDELPTFGATLPIIPLPDTGTTAERCRLLESLIL